MKVLASLTNRIFLASAALAVITVALAVYLVSASVTRETETGVSRDLVESAALVDQQRTAHRPRPQHGAAQLGGK